MVSNKQINIKSVWYRTRAHIALMYSEADSLGGKEKMKNCLYRGAKKSPNLPWKATSMPIIFGTAARKKASIVGNQQK